MIEIDAIDYLILLALSVPTVWVLGGYVGRFIGRVLGFAIYTIYVMVAGEPLTVHYKDQVSEVKVKGLLAARLVWLKCRREDFGFKTKAKKEEK